MSENDTYNLELTELLTKSQFDSLKKHHSEENIIMACKEADGELDVNLQDRKLVVSVFTIHNLTFKEEYKQKYCPHCKQECESLLSEAEIESIEKQSNV